LQQTKEIELEVDTNNWYFTWFFTRIRI